MTNRGRARDFRAWLVAAGFVVGVNTVGALPAFFFGADTDWIQRPWFYPPEIVFPIAWTILFTLLGIALFLVWRTVIDRRDVRLAIGIFAGQFAVNLAWTPVFFGLQRPGLGLVVIVALWVGVGATVFAFYRVSRPAGILVVPYFVWVGFATVLNYAIYAAA